MGPVGLDRHVLSMKRKEKLGIGTSLTRTYSGDLNVGTNAVDFGDYS